MNRKADGIAGFTLLEALLAMAILAVIMTVIYVSFSTAANNVQQAETLRDEADLARTLMARMSSEITNVYLKGNYPVIFRRKKEDLQTEGAKAGEKIRHDRIDLTTLTDPAWRMGINSKETELWEVGYFFKEKPDGKGYSLYRREKRELTKDMPVLEGGDEYEITDRVESLQFTSSNDGKTWTDNEWDIRASGNSVPKAVDIVLVLDTGKVYTTKVDISNR